jgi:hypothetical protein
MGGLPPPLPLATRLLLRRLLLRSRPVAELALALASSSMLLLVLVIVT